MNLYNINLLIELTKLNNHLDGAISQYDNLINQQRAMINDEFIGRHNYNVIKGDFNNG